MTGVDDHDLLIICQALGRDTIHDMVDKTNEVFRQLLGGDQPIHLSVGTNRGDAVAGYVGTDEHLNYTVIGDVVNTVQRLESIAEPDSILIGESVKDRIEGKLGDIEDIEDIVALSSQKVKGKEKPLDVYKILLKE